MKARSIIAIVAILMGCGESSLAGDFIFADRFQNPSVVPGVNGRIAFVDSGNGITLVQPDGTAAEQVWVSDGAFVDSPHWSPDVTRIAILFLEGSLAVIDADGANETELDATSLSGLPVWSPDGGRLAYSGYYYNGQIGYSVIWVEQADGSGRFRLTEYASGGESYPSWSPDGGRIVFIHYTRGMEVADVNSGDVTSLDTSRLLTRPSFSPDGTQVLYAIRNFLDDNYGVGVMAADGSNQVQLAGTEASTNFYPVWSPDGTRIAYATCPSIIRSSNPARLVVMNSDGSNPSELLADSESCPFNRFVWSPDSTKVALTLDGSVVSLPITGGSPEVVAESARRPSWSAALE